MKQNLNKEQTLQKIQVLTDTINDLIWTDSDDAEYLNLLGKVIDAKNDLHTYVHNAYIIENRNILGM